jgi:hypothetical protein
MSMLTTTDDSKQVERYDSRANSVSEDYDVVDFSTTNSTSAAGEGKGFNLYEEFSTREGICLFNKQPSSPRRGAKEIITEPKKKLMYWDGEVEGFQNLKV